jgi:uncharacterized membrane protein YkoI
MQTLKPKTLESRLAVLLLVLASLVAQAPSMARDEQSVVPMGALAHAAAALEQSTGGKVLEVRLANEAGPPAFEAAIATKGAVLYMRIESPRDDITRIKAADLPNWLLNYHMEAYMRSITKAQVPLDAAIRKAEERDNAPAIDAGLAKPLSGTNAVLAYFVETMKGSTRHDSAVDATTGAFIANPDELFEARKPVDVAKRLAPAAVSP